VNPWPDLWLAEVRLLVGRVQDAELELQAALNQMVKSPSTVAEPTAWAALSTLYRQGGWPSLAGEAAKRADPQTGVTITAWLVLTRRRLALPADAAKHGLTPERERDYIQTQSRAEQAINEGQTILAERFLHQIRHSFPSLPATNLLWCELDFTRGHLAEAAGACEAVLRQQEDAAPAQALAGIVASRRGQWPLAIRYLERALELDPEKPLVSKELAAARRHIRERDDNPGPKAR